MKYSEQKTRCFVVTYILISAAESRKQVDAVVRTAWAIHSVSDQRPTSHHCFHCLLEVIILPMITQLFSVKIDLTPYDPFSAISSPHPSTTFMFIHVALAYLVPFTRPPVPQRQRLDP